MSKPKKKIIVDNIKVLESESSSDESNSNKSTDYIKPEKTYTERLSKKEIADMLIDYQKVNSINELNDIPLGTHIRYFDTTGGKTKFRMGGNIIVKTGLPDYIMLSTGKINFSVQTKNKIFFRKINIQEVKDEYEKIIKNLNFEVIELKALVKNHKKLIIELQHQLSKYQKK